LHVERPQVLRGGERDGRGVDVTFNPLAAVEFASVVKFTAPPDRR
jgi:hypothetical protein